MARADSTSTTRRTFVRLAAAAALPVVNISGADAELVALAARLTELSGRIEAVSDDPSLFQLLGEGETIFDKMFQIEAASIAGLKAKCVALRWRHGKDPEAWDCEYTFDLVDELLAMNAAGA